MAGAADIHTQLCSLSECIPDTYISGINQRRNCGNYNRDACNTSDPYENDFYRLINWKDLHSNAPDFMDHFKERLNDMFIDNRDNFGDIVRNVFPQIQTLGNNLIIKLDIIGKQNNAFCNDINYSFSILCQGTDGRRSSTDKPYRLFHIALHSKRSKYYNAAPSGRTATRSQWTCGYYPKCTPEEINEHRDKHCVNLQASGPLHYKIDNYDTITEPGDLTVKKCNNKIDEYECPFKQFILEPGGAGRFLDNTIPFIFPKIHPTAHEQRVELINLHMFIYNEFIKYWNNIVLPRYMNRLVMKAKDIFKKKLSPVSSTRCLDCVGEGMEQCESCRREDDLRRSALHGGKSRRNRSRINRSRINRSRRYKSRKN